MTCRRLNKGNLLDFLGLFHCDQNQNVVNPENPKDCPYSNGGKSFSFLSLPSGDTVTYQVVNNQLVKSLTGNRPCWNSGVDMTPGMNCQILTSPEVVIINDIHFYHFGRRKNLTIQ